MNKANDTVDFTIQRAQQALQRGDRLAARRWAQQSISHDPNREEPWLILAAIADPRASLAYLNRALEINPQSQRARKGMHWAIKRQRSQPVQAISATVPDPIISEQFNQRGLVRIKQARAPWISILFLIMCGLIVWLGYPWYSQYLTDHEPMALAQVQLSKATRTPTPTATFTASPTFTATFTPTYTPTSTATYTPTPTFTPSATPTAPPPQPLLNQAPAVNLPPNVSEYERWIDVDLSSQTTFAYEGTQLVRRFTVSTGKWGTPTVVGQFKIYVKYRSQAMSGPGYYLPGVPYVMYFYKGYGLHGTYWHNNFGQPMSHGCVNLRTEDAKWLFKWASLGTIVNVHQ